MFDMHHLSSFVDTHYLIWGDASMHRQRGSVYEHNPRDGAVLNLIIVRQDLTKAWAVWVVVIYGWVKVHCLRDHNCDKSLGDLFSMQRSILQCNHKNKNLYTIRISQGLIV